MGFSLLDAETILGFGWKAAVDALEDTLLSGFDPESDPQRTFVPLEGSDMWFMPSQWNGWSGAKLVTVCLTNASRGLPTVQGVYVLSDTETATPSAILDGAALTTLRTAAVSALAIRYLTARPLNQVVVFGAGVQAKAHIEAMAATATIGTVGVVGRSTERVDALVADLVAQGIEARVATRDAVAHADAVVCTSSSPTPLFDGDLVAPHAVVVAIGSHAPHTREVDSVLVARSQVIVESQGNALRENGNILLANADRAPDLTDLGTLAALVTGGIAPDPERPRLFTGTGMGWQDLSVAAALHTTTTRSST